MKNINKTLLACLLSLVSLNVISAQSLPSRYVVTDPKKVEAATERVLAQEMTVDDMAKGWARSVINRVFEEYFKVAQPTGQIHEHAEFITFQEMIREVKNQLTESTEALKQVEKKLVKANEQREEELSAQKTKLDNEYGLKISALNKQLTDATNTIRTKDADIERIKADIAAKDKRIKGLEDEAKIARTVISKHNEKKNNINGVYIRSRNSDLPNIDAHGIIQAVKDYEDYVALVQLQIDPDVDLKLKYLKEVSSAGIFYQKAVSFMASRFSATEYGHLLNEYAGINMADSRLSDLQKTSLMRVGESLKALKASKEHLETNVLVFLKNEGLMPDMARVHDVKEQINFKIRLETDGEFCTDGKYYYNDYFKTLNNVLAMIYNDLREMDMAEYDKFLKQLKGTL